MVGCSQSLSFDSFSKVRGCTRVTRRFGRFGLLYRLLSMFSCWNSRTLIGPPVFSSGFEDAGARTSAFNTQPPTDCTQPTTSAGAAAASAHETASIPPRLCKCSQKATGLKSSVPRPLLATSAPQYATRSLLSRSRVDWAIEAARRVGAEPVGELGEAGLDIKGK